jgi:hypothetical protein
MKRNMGVADRIVRLIIAALIIVLGITGVISGTLLIVLGIVAAAFIITSILGLCPIYLLLRISTRRS